MGLLAFFKKIFGKKLLKDPKYINFVENILPDLKFGDVIYADRFFNEDEKKYMGMYHCTGPFVVITTIEDKIIGAYCTSSQTRKGTIQLCEDYDIFHRNKNTYVIVSDIRAIDYESFIDKYEEKLNEDDLNKIKKRLVLNKCNKYSYFGVRSDFNFDVKTDYEVNDVVSCGYTPYVIIDIINDELILLPIYYYNSKNSHLDISKVKIDYFNVKKHSKEGLYYLNTIPNSQMRVILGNYRNFLNSKNEMLNSANKLYRGCLIETFDGLYYVYGTLSNVANTFEVSKTNEDIEDAIVISGKKYKPNYLNNVDVDMKIMNYTIVDVASEYETTKIKEARKSYKKTHKDSIELLSKPLIGTIMHLKKDITKKYIMFYAHKGIYTAVSLDSLFNKNKIETVLISKKELKKMTNITAIELRVIQRKLLELGNKKLAESVLKKMPKQS